MLKTERQPAFWRVVRTRDGVREYLSINELWASEYAVVWQPCCHDLAVRAAKRLGGRVVPVYVTIRRVARGHDFAWAFRQSKAGKEVRVLQDNGVWRNCKTLEALVLVEAILKLSNAWQLGAQL